MSTEVEHLDQERVDELIWRGAGVKSVRKIAEETGLKPEEVTGALEKLHDMGGQLRNSKWLHRPILP